MTDGANYKYFTVIIFSWSLVFKQWCKARPESVRIYWLLSFHQTQSTTLLIMDLNYNMTAWIFGVWRWSSSSWTLHNRMCKATIPIVMERCVMTQWRQVGDGAWFGGDFECVLLYCLVLFNQDWSRLIGSYSNNIVVICCLPGMSLELSSQDIPAPWQQITWVLSP